MKEKEQFDLEEIKKKALEQFRSGKSLYSPFGSKVGSSWRSE